MNLRIFIKDIISVVRWHCSGKESLDIPVPAQMAAKIQQVNAMFDEIETRAKAISANQTLAIKEMKMAEQDQPKTEMPSHDMMYV